MRRPRGRPQIDGERTFIGSFHDPLSAALAIIGRFPDYYTPIERFQIGRAMAEPGMGFSEDDFEAVLFPIGTKLVRRPPYPQRPGTPIPELFDNLKSSL